ncbi:MAG TPA: alpha/beta hydrolase, partial [Ideonella sp.]|nr:alpha/beta hydrolase [Ideonella sp.]
SGTRGLADVVEAVHHTVLQVPGPLGKVAPGRTRGITGLVYRNVHGVAGLVGGGLDLALQVFSSLDKGASGPRREALLAALNGVLGDHLAATKNPLATPMAWRQAGRDLDLQSAASLSASLAAPASGRLLVLVHGLCMNDAQWLRNGHDHGAALAAEAGWTPVYLRYNSGLHIAHNGAQLARELEALLRAWPVPVEELALLGHSMGGLVARSAVQQARAGRLAWPRALRRMVFAGTPHHGAPLERGGHWIDTLMRLSPYIAPLARVTRLRSAGITDLRHGGGPALPRGVRCFALAATTGEQPGGWRDTLLGDGLVPLRSALGEHEDAALALGLPAAHKAVITEAGHFDLLDRPAAYEQLRRWLG